MILIISGIRDLFNFPKMMEYSIYYSFEDSPISITKFNFDSIKMISTEKCQDGTFVKIISQEFSVQQLPNYLILYVKQNKQNFNSYSIELKKLDFMKPIRLKLESKDSSVETQFKSMMEIGIIKYSDRDVGDSESELYSFLYSLPNYSYDVNLHNSIYESVQPFYIDGRVSSYLGSRYNYYSKEIMKQMGSQGKNTFLLNKFKENSIIHKDLNSGLSKLLQVDNMFIFGNCLSTSDITPLGGNTFDPKEKINELIVKLFPKTNELIKEWIKAGTSSFEEILFSVTFVDSGCATIYDKLQLLFDICKMQNLIFFNENKVSMDKLKELVYILYKRYMIYFTRSDVSRLVDNLIKKENLYSYKNVLLFNSQYKEEVYELLNGKGHTSTSSILM